MPTIKDALDIIGKLTLADPHKYQEREWGKTSISIALELALDAVLSVVEE
ncbi:hypothetical protein ACT3X0_001975 [Campylobacter jejuni]|uniref:Uncharacterized protein n=2 Tax=Campylobacteraceae TaxID=72294 RepID=Q4VRA0_CAMJU|nr:unknown [Campylobacter jejuni]